jgi:glucuronosyltransferase
MYIGPISPQDPTPLPLEFEKILAASDNTILLSFGTTFFHSSLLEVVRGLSNFAIQQNERDGKFVKHNYQVIVQFCSSLLPRFEKVLAESKYIKYYPWVPQLQLLAHPKVKFFVSHCGVNGIMESLYFGKPVLGMIFCCALIVFISLPVCVFFCLLCLLVFFPFFFSLACVYT